MSMTGFKYSLDPIKLRCFRDISHGIQKLNFLPIKWEQLTLYAGDKFLDFLKVVFFFRLQF